MADVLFASNLTVDADFTQALTSVLDGIGANLLNLWKLDESNGDAIDAIGGLNGTDQNTVGSATGQVDGARNFDPDSDEHFTLGGSGDLNFDGSTDFTISGWVYFEDFDNEYGIIGKYFRNTNQKQWQVRFVPSSATTGHQRLSLSIDGVNVSTVTDSTIISAGGWHHFFAEYRAGPNDSAVRTDNGTEVVNTGAPSAIFQGSAVPSIGSDDVVATTTFMDGRIDEVSVWDRLLSEEEKDVIFGIGQSGVSLAEFVIKKVASDFEAAADFTCNLSTSFSIAAAVDVDADFTQELTTGFLEFVATDLRSYYKCEEAGGTRADSFSNVDLADVNSVVQRAGKIGRAAFFDQTNQEYLNGGDVHKLGDTDWTIAGWFRLDSKTTFQSLVAKWDTGTSNQSFLLQYSQGNDRLRFVVSDDGSNVVLVTGNSFGSPPTGTFFFLVVWHDSVANTINIQINNGTVDSAAHSAGIFVGTADFRIGASVVELAQTFDGRADEVTIWDRVLSADERGSLYSAGDGVDLEGLISFVDFSFESEATADFTAAFDTETPADLASIVNDLRSHYKLQGLTDSVRVDSVGSHDMGVVIAPTRVDGQIEKAANFDRSSTQSLKLLSNRDDVHDFGDEDFTLAMWARLTTKTLPAQTIVSKFFADEAGGHQYFVDYVFGGIDRFRFLVDHDGANPAQIVEADNFGSPTAGQWVFIVAWHDSVANTINIQVNNGTPNSLAHSLGVNQGKGVFHIGAYQDGSGNQTEFFNGDVDEVSVWARVLTSAERTALYNSGGGIDITRLFSFVEFAGSGAVDFEADADFTCDLTVYAGDLGEIRSDWVSHWPLGESAGQNAVDFVAATMNDLSPTNSPSQVAAQIGNGKNFDESNQEDFEIAHASQTDLTFPNTQSFTFGGWFRMTNKTAVRIMFAKNIQPNDREYNSFYDTTADRFGWELHHDTLSNFTRVDADGLGSPSAGTWYYLTFFYDAVAQTMNISADAIAPDSVAYANPINQGVSPFWLGVWRGGPGAVKALWWHGDMDEVTVWKRVLSQSERTALYNGGSGVDLTQNFFSFDFEAAADFTALMNDTRFASQVFVDADFTCSLTVDPRKLFECSVGVDTDFTVNLDTPLTGIGAAIDSHYALEEASGTRLDSTGNLINLSDVNTVTQNTGQIGNASEHDRVNQEYLSGGDVHKKGDEDFTITGWFLFDSKTDFMTLVAKWDTGTSNQSYLLQYEQSADKLRFVVSSDGSAVTFERADVFGAPPTATFFFVVVWHDSVANTINIQVNNGTVDSQSYSSGVFSGTGDFRIGASVVELTQTLDGRADEVTVFNRVLTADERTSLYGAGAGRNLEDSFLKEFAF